MPQVAVMLVVAMATLRTWVWATMAKKVLVVPLGTMAQMERRM
jgi:hypothetical protein